MRSTSHTLPSRSRKRTGDWTRTRRSKGTLRQA
jgi:hypothetical protein